MDLELARSLVDSLLPARREELERESAERFGTLGEEETRKAVPRAGRPQQLRP